MKKVYMLFINKLCLNQWLGKNMIQN